MEINGSNLEIAFGNIQIIINVNLKDFVINVNLKDFGRKGLSVSVDLLDSHVAHDCPLVTLHCFQANVCHLQIETNMLTN